MLCWSGFIVSTLLGRTHASESGADAAPMAPHASTPLHVSAAFARQTADVFTAEYNASDGYERMTGRSLQSIADHVSRAVPRIFRLPEPKQWESWHANVVLPERPNGAPPPPPPPPPSPLSVFLLSNRPVSPVWDDIM